MSNITPSSTTIAQAHPERATIRVAWEAVRHEARPLDYATYALARQIHAATRPGYEVSASELLERSLRKLVRTLGPVRNKNELANGRKQFDTLQAILLTLKSYGPGSALAAVLDDEECGQITKLADTLVDEVRRRGRQALLELAPPQVIRSKKPFVRR